MKSSVKQKTIGINPLEEYLSSATRCTDDSAKTTDALESHEEPVKKQRVTIHVPIGLIDKVKNAVFWEPGLTLAGFAQEALEQALEKLESERGSPFPDRREKRLKAGRPIK